MRNNPFTAPPAALPRPAGHRAPVSGAKQDFLYRPLAATGVPLGGIGTGAITRASDGRFSRWTVKAGGIRRFGMPANGFALRVDSNSQQAAIALQPAPDTAELSAFTFEPDAPEWHGLFPFAWHRHAAFQGITAECMSFSPVIPGDAAAAGLPVALFRWRLTNTTDTAVDATIAFHFANLNGWFADFGEDRPDRPAPGCENSPMDVPNGSGVVLDRNRVASEPAEGTGQWAISATGSADWHFARTVCFDGTGDGADFWNAFVATGDAPDLGPGWRVESGFRENAPAHPTAAVSARTTLSPGQEREVTFALVWDLPVITFGQGRRWFRAYTDEWGRTGTAAAAISRHAHDHADDWQSAITGWHDTVATELGDEPHRAGMAINESYFLVEGLTVHTSAYGSPDGKPHFGIIECHDYALYNTLDLWVYAAEAVARFLPDVAAGVAADYASHVAPADTALRRHRWDGNLFPLNPAGACPHDLGGPQEDPFIVANSYTYRDATIWKDLNCDFVLCVFREGRAMSADWRRALFPAVRAAIDHLQQFDTDGDGLIENDGSPDQTFDNIPMRGPSAYCGGLWIAALRAAAVLATEAGEPVLARQWTDQATAAESAFDRLLFNGSWYRVDTAGPLSEACFIEQLFGPFLARRLGLGDIVPADQARAALAQIYQRNFVDEGAGEGAVSLAGVPASAHAHLPHQDDTTFQTAEIQPGFNFSLAAQLEAWDLTAEADHLRRALYDQLYVKRNLVFQTPAAIDQGRLTCRAVLNMRPLAVWWMRPV